MGGDAGAGQGGIGSRRLQPLGVPLEGQHPIAEHPGLAQGFAQTERHRAEVLADDEAFGPGAFQRQFPQQVLQRIGDIGPRLARRAVGDPELSGQAHHVVDPEGAGVAHVAGEDVRHHGVAIFREPVRIIGRQAPDLSLRRDRIGRRADPDPLGQQIGVRPALGAVRRGADRQVAAEPDRQAAGASGCGGQLPLAQPLDVHVEPHASGVGGGEAADALPLRTLEIGRPVEP